MCISVEVQAQNLQVHYDYDRDYFTSTIEMFKPDSTGATFFFVDFDYNHPGTHSASLAYWEIARYFNIPSVRGLSWTLQFHDGTAPWGPLGDVWLAGLSYPVDLGIITFTTDILYCMLPDSDATDFQVSLIWFKPIIHSKITLKGFLYIWSRDQTKGADSKEIVVLSEPQIWFQAIPNLAIGGELEIGKKFLPEPGWTYKPTLGIMWTF